MKNYSKIPRGGGLKGNTLKKYAFTLAEVLITLAVIGIVAAVSIPPMVASYKKQQMYSRFMKTYNSLLQAASASFAINGEPMTWGEPEWTGNNGDGENISGLGFAVPNGSILADKTFGQLKCVDSFDPRGENHNNRLFEFFSKSYKTLGGDPMELNDILEIFDVELQEADFEALEELGAEGSIEGFVNRAAGWTPVCKLGDGSSVLLAAVFLESFGGYTFGFLFDTNGPDEPNMLGRDLFAFGYANYEGTIVTDAKFSASAPLKVIMYPWSEDKNDKLYNTCNPDIAGDIGTLSGIGCASRLVQQEKMAY